MSRRDAPTHPTALCGPDCKYRGLYEGTQRSLADLAARQADALGRLGRLRQSVVATLKRFFPAEFHEAEHALGQRLSDVSDDLLGAYIESFLQLAAEKVPAAGSDIARLRQGLTGLGVDVAGAFTVADLARAIERRGPAPALPATPDLSTVFSSSWTPAPPSRAVAPSAPVARVVTSVPARPRTSEPPHTDHEVIGDELGGYDEEYYAEAPLDPDFRPSVTPAPTSTGPSEHPTSPPEALEAPATPGSLDDLFAVPLTPSARPGRSRRPDSVPGPWAADALKPTALPVGSSKPRPARTTRRNSRVAAVGPITVTELDPDVRNQLLAAVCVPRPVFIADLIDLVNSSEVVAAWEESWAHDPDLAIRFISPKPRHKQRGALVFPQEYLRSASPEFKQSLWARVLNAYHGAKAYELGIFLHRFNEEVVGDDLGSRVALFRLNRPQGLIGVIIVLDSALSPTGETRADLVVAMETLLRERLVQIAVLSINADLLDAISEVITEEASSHSWVPTAPVTLSKSWDYTAGTGVALPLLGV